MDSVLRLLFLLLAGCGGGSGPAGRVPPEGCDSAVFPEDDARAAQTVLIEAAAESTVCFLEGTYRFDAELSLATDGVTLRGAGKDVTILDFSAQLEGGTGANGLSLTGDRITVEGFSIVDTDGDGIRASEVEDVVFRDAGISWSTPEDEENGGYGIYPVGSTGVLVEGCTASGASDTGIYVGQSSRILVRDNEVFGNVVGIEIENSTDAEVTGNHAHDNAGGILAFNLPGLPMQGGARANVHDNLIERNNVRNFAPGGTVANVPTGTGVLILSSDDNEIHANEIRDNVTAGVMILHYDPALIGAYDDDTFDPFPQGNWVHGNAFSANGEDPQGMVAILLGAFNPFPDLSWDGCEDPDADNSDGSLTNCFSDNGDADYLNYDYCNDLRNPTTDAAPVTCEHEPLPPQDF